MDNAGQVSIVTGPARMDTRSTGPAVAPPEPGGPARRRRVLTALICCGLVYTVGLWWVQTKAPDVVGGPAVVTAAGRLAGLVGGYLLLVQVLLMSRVPAIDRAVSGARKSMWHRHLGAFVVIVISAHVTLITIGYAAIAGTGVLHEVWTLLTTYQDIISATVAFGILVSISVLAVRAIRTRLPYGAWHAMHSSVYLVLLFVYGHQLADGQQFVLNRAARVYWYLLYLGVVAALAYGRLVVPLRLNLRHQLRVKAVVDEAPGVVSIYLTGQRLAELPVQAGQYARWRFLIPDGWRRSHPFSLSAAPGGGYLRVTVKALGDYSARLHRIPPGTRVLVEAPSGEFTAAHRSRPKALLIAGGTGITPVRAVLETLPRGAIVLYRARTERDLIFKAELDRLASYRKARMIYLVGPRTDPALAHVLTAPGLRKLVPDIASRDVYVCGPRGLAETVTATLLDLRVPLKQIHLDPFEL